MSDYTPGNHYMFRPRYINEPFRKSNDYIIGTLISIDTFGNATLSCQNENWLVPSEYLISCEGGKRNG